MLSQERSVRINPELDLARAALMCLCPGQRDRDLLHDLDIEAYQSCYPPWMIGKQPNAAQVQVGKDLRANAYIALSSALALGQRG